MRKPETDRDKGTVELWRTLRSRAWWEGPVSGGSNVTRDDKTFLATSRLTGGVIRVVIVRFEDGWAPHFCTAPAASVGHPGSSGRPLGHREILPRREESLGSGSAAGSERVVEPGLLAVESVAIHACGTKQLGHRSLRPE